MVFQANSNPCKESTFLKSLNPAGSNRTCTSRIVESKEGPKSPGKSLFHLDI